MSAELDRASDQPSEEEIEEHSEIPRPPPTRPFFERRRTTTLEHALFLNAGKSSISDIDVSLLLGEGPILRGDPVDTDELEQDDFGLAKFVLEETRFPDLPAVRTRGLNGQGELVEFSYAELRRSAYFAANLLYKHGIRKGAKVLLLQWNSWACMCAYWGVHYLGAVAVMATPAHAERKYLLKYTGCQAVVAPQSIDAKLKIEIDDRTHVRLLLLTDCTGPDAVEQVRTRVPCTNDDSACDHLFDADGLEHTETDKYTVLRFEADFADQLDAGPAESFASIERDDECLWYFTSGTTGKPKGCVHSQPDLVFAANTYGPLLSLGPGSTTATDVLMAGPYAMGTNNIFPLCLGACIYLDHTIKALAPAHDAVLMACQSSTVFVSIPGTILHLTRKLREGNAEYVEALKKVAIITTAGAPLPPSVYLNFDHAAKAVGCTTDVLDGIGTSEVQHIFISNTVGNVLSDKGCVGTIVPGYEVRLLNSTKKGLDWQGELMVRTCLPFIRMRYSNERPPEGVDYDEATTEATQDAFDDNGAAWYITGDVARLKKQGGEWQVYLLGRMKDITLQIADDNNSRGLSLEDYALKGVANGIMMHSGLYARVDEIADALGVHDVLIEDVWPLKVTRSGGERAVYVCAISPHFWTDHQARPDFDAWDAYLRKKDAVPPEEKELLVFWPAALVPRTAPPLLKPKPGEMRGALQRFVDAHDGELDQALLFEASISIAAKRG